MGFRNLIHHEVLEREGIPPCQLSTFLCLGGDKEPGFLTLPHVAFWSCTPGLLCEGADLEEVPFSSELRTSIRPWLSRWQCPWGVAVRTESLNGIHLLKC